MTEDLTDTVETLAGKRRRALGRAAVRIEDLRGMMDVAERLQSAAATGAAPTKAEHDALVRDVQMLHQALKTMATALRGRMIDA